MLDALAHSGRLVMNSAPKSRPNYLLTVIPVYNGEKYIARALQSVAGQTRRPDRLMVLDNCSTDNTRQVVQQFKGMDCEWRQNPRNLGLFGNLNRALEFAPEAEYLHILHADDLIKPDFYRRCLEVSEGAAGRALIYSGADLIDQDDRPVPHTPSTRPKVANRVVPVKEFLAGRAELRPFYFPGVLLKTGGQPSPCKFPEDMPQLGDQVFWGDWAVNCRCIYEIGESLCQYRVHPENTTNLNTSSLQAWVLDEWKAMQHLQALLGESGILHWLRNRKLKCIFAARSCVKINMVRKSSPEFAHQVRVVTRDIVGPVCSILGDLAVKLLR